MIYRLLTLPGQVRPDPGPQCRSAFVPLISISALGIFMDVLLILSPIPAIVRSSFTTTKKIRLILTTFGLSVFCIAFAGYRVPAVIKDHGSQQYRSLLASFEILTATVVSNAIVINSFARGKGAKRRKFSGETGLEGGEGGMVRMSYWGSDDDLVRDVGGGRIFGVVPSQKGYGISNRHGQLAQLEPAVLKPVERRGNVPVWELKERGEDTPITPPTTPKLERDTTKLYDEGGFLGAGDESEDDMQPCTSVSSSKVGLRPGHRAKDGR